MFPAAAAALADDGAGTRSEGNRAEDPAVEPRGARESRPPSKSKLRVPSGSSIGEDGSKP